MVRSLAAIEKGDRHLTTPWYLRTFCVSLGASPLFQRSFVAGELSPEPQDGVVILVDDPFLERNDGVVGDVDAFGADLGAALGDVAQANPHVAADQFRAVDVVEGMHLEP